ncbi:NADPH-dependent oxidoreductase [Xanthobacter dioxanivorans]|uniref:NADPH-dependent oxidoreductase n=1 Tax=Xanthobacter dioxanivorans TaxID=2528964 RepID=A0A974PT63_9HYPH|nr:NADPH-dependent oxidoreductase [Xanthobacter dioxanivorans]QRG09342.1 NADPH-dependent oxidoreductase [Xanthobacter dioxanivorans]
MSASASASAPASSVSASTSAPLAQSRPAAATQDARALLEARYGAAEAPQGLLLNDTIAGLLAHRSVRAFSDRALPEGLIETLVAAAQSASSSSNLQTFSVVAVENPATKARLAQVAGGQKHIVEAPLVLVWLADLARLEEIGRRAGAPTGGLAFLETLFIGIIDAALAAQNAVVALESLGLGSVYIGALRNRPQEVAELLGLPPNVVGVFGLCVGYADPAARPADVKPRLSQKLVLHRERYDAGLPQPPLDQYEAALKAFQRGQEMPVVGWAGTALNRVRGPEALSGRDRMREALTALGFGLR